MAEQRRMTDFVEILTSMRDGQVMRDLSDKFNEVLAAVIDTAGKGELTVTFTLEPEKMGLGGIVLEIAAEHKTKIKKPELPIGSSRFFVAKDGRLTRNNPNQEDMFVSAEVKEIRQ